ncbi:MerR family transcriptional regulator [Actinoplanes sp. SE50]|uniref:MerR family transcriptional regulator n=1 Tax=unclassified Actinoplanes TaxID=2626549 RepID=UPI00023EC7DB|nr:MULTISPECIES: GyrI-like domain-containing protein [unclassified Actinoplanes]AEV84731.1 Multidrug-efflux transporter 1 regulator [Actinoplanes sp. SE50/110]ATO83123.1 MerR family transcriptional regulator [Actinoplanes sp. SE50]SLM00530.1 MerR-family transcriptional regulator [Actinoplanes sp. SE50/110]
MDDLLPIGAFSRATLISANTLRAYHENGLLEPAVVDQRTGYRGYRIAQLGDAATIRQLRELDLPLADIRVILAARDPEVTRRVLAAQRRRLLDRQARLERMLRITGDLLDDPVAITPAEVTARTLPPITAFTLTRDAREDQFADFLGEAYAELTARAIATGPCGAIFPPEFRDEPSPIIAYVPAANGDTTLPGGRFAVAEFVGPYYNMSEGYRALGAWLARTGLAITGPVRESYLVGPGDGVPEEEFRTEICWPVSR